MALKGTDKTKTKAAQALASITISINPEISFPGQRVRFSNIFQIKEIFGWFLLRKKTMQIFLRFCA